jgi:hypothetical protein
MTGISGAVSQRHEVRRRKERAVPNEVADDWFDVPSSQESFQFSPPTHIRTLTRTARHAFQTPVSLLTRSPFSRSELAHDHKSNTPEICKHPSHPKLQKLSYPGYPAR